MAKTLQKKSESVLIEVKIGDISPDAYVQRHVDVSCLSALQGGTLARITAALQAGGVQLRGGRFITSGADSIRYLLERLGEEAGLSNGTP